jgi:serine/threonine protein kinase
MGENKQVTCQVCFKPMRSNNLNRHMKVHDKHVEVEPLPSISLKSEDKLFSSGTLEDNYEVEEVLGKGGFGIVYAGIRKKDKMKVAIKHIAKGKVTDMEMVNI